MVPLLQVQLVQALAFQESPASSTSPSLVMQYSCWLLFTGSRGPSSAAARTVGGEEGKVKIEVFRVRKILSSVVCFVFRLL